MDVHKKNLSKFCRICGSGERSIDLRPERKTDSSFLASCLTFLKDISTFENEDSYVYPQYICYICYRKLNYFKNTYKSRKLLDQIDVATFEEHSHDCAICNASSNIAVASGKKRKHAQCDSTAVDHHAEGSGKERIIISSVTNSNSLNGGTDISNLSVPDFDKIESKSSCFQIKISTNKTVPISSLVSDETSEKERKNLLSPNKKIKILSITEVDNSDIVLVQDEDTNAKDGVPSVMEIDISAPPSDSCITGIVASYALNEEIIIDDSSLNKFQVETENVNSKSPTETCNTVNVIHEKRLPFFCRVCGQHRIGTSKRNSGILKTSKDVKKYLKNLFRVNVNNESPFVYPPSVCCDCFVALKSSYRSLLACRKSGKSEPNIDLEVKSFSECRNSESCNICSVELKSESNLAKNYSHDILVQKHSEKVKRNLLKHETKLKTNKGSKLRKKGKRNMVDMRLERFLLGKNCDLNRKDTEILKHMDSNNVNSFISDSPNDCGPEDIKYSETHLNSPESQRKLPYQPQDKNLAAVNGHVHKDPDRIKVIAILNDILVKIVEKTFHQIDTATMNEIIGMEESVGSYSGEKDDVRKMIYIMAVIMTSLSKELVADYIPETRMELTPTNNSKDSAAEESFVRADEMEKPSGIPDNTYAEYFSVFERLQNFFKEHLLAGKKSEPGTVKSITKAKKKISDSDKQKSSGIKSTLKQFRGIVKPSDRALIDPALSEEYSDHNYKLEMSHTFSEKCDCDALFEGFESHSPEKAVKELSADLSLMEADVVSYLATSKRQSSTISSISNEDSKAVTSKVSCSNHASEYYNLADSDVAVADLDFSLGENQPLIPAVTLNFSTEVANLADSANCTEDRPLTVSTDSAFNSGENKLSISAVTHKSIYSDDNTTADAAVPAKYSKKIFNGNDSVLVSSKFRPDNFSDAESEPRTTIVNAGAHSTADNNSKAPSLSTITLSAECRKSLAIKICNLSSDFKGLTSTAVPRNMTTMTDTCKTTASDYSNNIVNVSEVAVYGTGGAPNNACLKGSCIQIDSLAGVKKALVKGHRDEDTSSHSDDDDSILSPAVVEKLMRSCRERASNAVSLPSSVMHVDNKFIPNPFVKTSGTSSLLRSVGHGGTHTETNIVRVTPIVLNKSYTLSIPETVKLEPGFNAPSLPVAVSSETDEVYDGENMDSALPLVLENSSVTSISQSDFRAMKDDASLPYTSQAQDNINSDTLDLYADAALENCPKPEPEVPANFSVVDEKTGKVIIKKHQCKFCGKFFRKPSEVVRHSRTHTGEKPFACDICNKRFCARSSLRSHKEIHSRDKRLDCDICSLSFATATSLRNHKRIHASEFPVSCRFCPNRFRAPGNCKIHMTKCHPAEMQNASTLKKIGKLQNTKDRLTKVVKVGPDDVKEEAHSDCDTVVIVSESASSQITMRDVVIGSGSEFSCSDAHRVEAAASVELSCSSNLASSSSSHGTSNLCDVKPHTNQKTSRNQFQVDTVVNKPFISRVASFSSSVGRSLKCNPADTSKIGSKSDIYPSVVSVNNHKDYIHSSASGNSVGSKTNNSDYHTIKVDGSGCDASHLQMFKKQVRTAGNASGHKKQQFKKTDTTNCQSTASNLERKKKSTNIRGELAVSAYAESDHTGMLGTKIINQYSHDDYMILNEDIKIEPMDDESDSVELVFNSKSSVRRKKLPQTGLDVSAGLHLDVKPSVQLTPKVRIKKTNSIIEKVKEAQIKRFHQSFSGDNLGTHFKKEQRVTVKQKQKNVSPSFVARCTKNETQHMCSEGKTDSVAECKLHCRGNINGKNMEYLEVKTKMPTKLVCRIGEFEQQSVSGMKVTPKEYKNNSDSKMFLSKRAAKRSLGDDVKIKATKHQRLIDTTTSKESELTTHQHPRTIKQEGMISKPYVKVNQRERLSEKETCRQSDTKVTRSIRHVKEVRPKSEAEDDQHEIHIKKILNGHGRTKLDYSQSAVKKEMISNLKVKIDQQQNIVKKETKTRPKVKLDLSTKNVKKETVYEAKAKTVHHGKANKKETNCVLDPKTIPYGKVFNKTSNSKQRSITFQSQKLKESDHCGEINKNNSVPTPSESDRQVQRAFPCTKSLSAKMLRRDYPLSKSVSVVPVVQNEQSSVHVVEQQLVQEQRIRVCEKESEKSSSYRCSKSLARNRKHDNDGSSVQQLTRLSIQKRQGKNQIAGTITCKDKLFYLKSIATTRESDEDACEKVHKTDVNSTVVQEPRKMVTLDPKEVVLPNSNVPLIEEENDAIVISWRD